MSKLAEDYTNTQYKTSNEALASFTGKIAEGISELDSEVRAIGEFAVRGTETTHVGATAVNYSLLNPANFTLAA